jgi:hypothetical protein
MNPIEALKHIRTLVKAAEEADDPALTRRHMKEIGVIVDQGLQVGSVIPMRPRSRVDSSDPDDS